MHLLERDDRPLLRTLADDADAGRAAARGLAAHLRRAGASRVVLFGSLAGPGGLVHERSDIDVAVDGLSPEGWRQALARAGEVEGFSVDVVRLDAAGPALRARIVEEGEELDVP